MVKKAAPTAVHTRPLNQPLLAQFNTLFSPEIPQKWQKSLKISFFNTIVYFMIMKTVYRSTKYDISLKFHVICDHYHSDPGLFSGTYAMQARS
jgi:hypothetical protein